MPKRAFIVANPKGAQGQVEKEWERIERLVQNRIPEVDYAFTEGPQHATLLTREAIRAGWDMIIAVGGDGTLNEVTNGFFEKIDAQEAYEIDTDGYIRAKSDEDTLKSINPEAEFGFIPMGTGGDFRRTIGVMGGVNESVLRIANSDPRPLDVGQIVFRNHDGKLESRTFMNIASAGMGGVVDQTVNKMWKGLGGKASFLAASTIAWFQYDNMQMTAKIDNLDEVDDKFFQIVVANGQYFGGGMWVAPGAELADGQFQVLFFADMKKSESLMLSSKIYKGTHLDLDTVTRRYAKSVSIKTTERDAVLLDVDGEQPGRLPALFRVNAGSLLMRA